MKSGKRGTKKEEKWLASSEFADYESAVMIFTVTNTMRSDERKSPK